MPPGDDLAAVLAGLPSGISGAGYNASDPLAGLWEYWRPGGNGGGQAALSAFYNSGRWRDIAPGVSDAVAKSLYDNLMARYGASAPGGTTGSGGSAYTPPTTDLPGPRRPPEAAFGADALELPSYLPASSPWTARGRGLLGALDGIGAPAGSYGLPKPQVRRPGLLV